MKLFGVALAGLEESGERFEHLQSGLLIDGTDIGLGLIGPNDALS